MQGLLFKQHIKGLVQSHEYSIESGSRVQRGGTQAVGGKYCRVSFKLNIRQVLGRGAEGIGVGRVKFGMSDIMSRLAALLP